MISAWRAADHVNMSCLLYTSGKEEFLMGNVDDGIVRMDIRDEFKTCNVYAKEKCRNCFAKFYLSLIHI